MSTTQLPPAAVRRREGLLVVLPGALPAGLLTVWNYSSKPMWRNELFTCSTVERPLTGMLHLRSDTAIPASTWWRFSGGDRRDRP